MSVELIEFAKRSGELRGAEGEGVRPSTHTQTHTHAAPASAHPPSETAREERRREGGRNRAKRTWKILDGAPRSGRGGERGRGGGSKQDTHKHTLMHTCTPAVTNRIEAEFNNDLELSERGRSSEGGREWVRHTQPVSGGIQ